MGKFLVREKEAERIWKPTLPDESLAGVLIEIRKVHFGRVLIVRGSAYDPEGWPIHEGDIDWLVIVEKGTNLSTEVTEAGIRKGFVIIIGFNGTGRICKCGHEREMWDVTVSNRQIRRYGKIRVIDRPLEPWPGNAKESIH